MSSSAKPFQTFEGEQGLTAQEPRMPPVTRRMVAKSVSDDSVSDSAEDESVEDKSHKCPHGDGRRYSVESSVRPTVASPSAAHSTNGQTSESDHSPETSDSPSADSQSDDENDVSASHGRRRADVVQEAQIRLNMRRHHRRWDEVFHRWRTEWWGFRFLIYRWLLPVFFAVICSRVFQYVLGPLALLGLVSTVITVGFYSCMLAFLTILIGTIHYICLHACHFLHPTTALLPFIAVPDACGILVNATLHALEQQDRLVARIDAHLPTMTELQSAYNATDALTLATHLLNPVSSALFEMYVHLELYPERYAAPHSLRPYLQRSITLMDSDALALYNFVAQEEFTRNSYLTSQKQFLNNAERQLTKAQSRHAASQFLSNIFFDTFHTLYRFTPSGSILHAWLQHLENNIYHLTMTEKEGNRTVTALHDLQINLAGAKRAFASENQTWHTACLPYFSRPTTRREGLFGLLGPTRVIGPTPSPGLPGHCYDTSTPEERILELSRQTERAEELLQTVATAVEYSMALKRHTVVLRQLLQEHLRSLERPEANFMAYTRPKLRLENVVHMMWVKYSGIDELQRWMAEQDHMRFQRRRAIGMT